MGSDVDLACFTHASTWESFIAASLEQLAGYSVELHAMLPPRATELQVRGLNVFIMYPHFIEICPAFNLLIVLPLTIFTNTTNTCTCTYLHHTHNPLAPLASEQLAAPTGVSTDTGPVLLPRQH